QEFRVEVAAFHRFVAEQLDKFHALSDLASQRRQKRESDKSSRSRRTHEKLSQRIQKLTEEMEEKALESMSMSNQLESVNERLRYFEKRFQQIASATGLTNPDAIINKFALKEEIRSEL